MDLNNIDDPATATDPGATVERATSRVLELAGTWLGWDGHPRLSEEGDRIYTPHKVIRRYGDHLIDHLAEVEARLAGVPSRRDGWHGSLVTVDSDGSLHRGRPRRGHRTVDPALDDVPAPPARYRSGGVEPSAR